MKGRRGMDPGNAISWGGTGPRPKESAEPYIRDRVAIIGNL